MYATQTVPPRRYWFFLAVFFVQLVLIPALSLFSMVEWGGVTLGEKIFQEGIRIASLPVGGHLYAEARQKLQEAVQARQRTEIRFVLDGQAYPIDASKLQIRFDVEAALQEAYARSREKSGFFSRLWGASAPVNVPIKVTYDRAELARQLDAIGQTIERPAVAATGVVSGNTISIVPEVVGYRLDLEQSLSAFEQVMSANLADWSGELRLAVQEDVPPLRKSELESIKYLLAEQYVPTAVSGSSGLTNLQQLVSRLNGSIVLPGQTFSFLEATGPYKQENGYVPLPALADEQVAIDQLGGAATQAATALYQAVLKNRLSVIERYVAPRPVTYASAGLEALVKEDECDLRFVNTTKTPLFIHAALANNQVRLALFGAKPDVPAATLVTEKGETVLPSTIVRVDHTLGPNEEAIERKGSEGFTVAVYQSWQENGAWRKQKVSEDYYKPLHNIVAVGPVHEKDKKQATAAQGEQQEGDAAQAPVETADDSETSAAAPPPDISGPSGPATGATDESAGEPRVENGIIYQR
ncbi:VanW family protein [Brevibacillus sp. SAFN-007a]|uniref:VanW family protein n=1 Tax=Brevibacillus sp. SAFN-007a TaxID=3436862 RepID=UPI003F7D42F8